MLYETLLQPLILLQILGVGFLSGIVFDFNTFFYVLCDKNKIARLVLDIVSTLVVFVIFFLLILNISYGEIRFYQAIFFVLALWIERLTIGKLVAKAIFVCYNFCGKIMRKTYKKLSKRKQ
ncbi:MAG: spore cortex biosynthesis protein YabQ [Clostridia bacterium]|nr:spore cortex biosynthesis protein YabQ [Clostridia bacterium]